LISNCCGINNPIKCDGIPIGHPLRDPGLLYQFRLDSHVGQARGRAPDELIKMLSQLDPVLCRSMMKVDQHYICTPCWCLAKGYPSERTFRHFRSSVFVKQHKSYVHGNKGRITTGGRKKEERDIVMTGLRYAIDTTVTMHQEIMPHKKHIVLQFAAWEEFRTEARIWYEKHMIRQGYDLQQLHANYRFKFQLETIKQYTTAWYPEVRTQTITTNNKRM
jgi:hypothetical protein